MSDRPKLCDWCHLDSDEVPVSERVHAEVRITFTDLEGVVLDFAYLCSQCAKRGATWDGRMLDAKD